MLERISYEAVLKYGQMPDLDIECLELSMLRERLCHARDTVPYYVDAFLAAGFDPATLQRAADLRLLPFLDKSLILHRPEKFRSSAFDDSGLRMVQTGGSTSEPFYKTAPDRTFVDRRVRDAMLRIHLPVDGYCATVERDP